MALSAPQFPHKVAVKIQQHSRGHLASAGPTVGRWPSLCPPNTISFKDQDPLPATLMGDAASICCHGYRHPAGPPTGHLMEGLWWAPGGGTSLGGFAPRLTTSLPTLPKVVAGSPIPNPLITAASPAQRAPGPLPRTIRTGLQDPGLGLAPGVPSPTPSHAQPPPGRHLALFPIH